MHKDIETLQRIQAFDQRLKKLDQEVAALPRRVAEIEASLSAHQQALQKSKEAQAANLAERRAVERAIQDAREKIEKHRSRSSEVKTNQEYKALLDEIAFSETEIRKYEDRILQLMEEAEARDSAVRKAEQELAEEQRRVDSEKQDAERRTAADRAEIAEIRARREALRADVGERALRQYDRVARLRGVGLAPVDAGTCGACRVRLRPQVVQEIMNEPDRLFICESCGRLIYAEPSVGIETSAVGATPSASAAERL
jgi:predicted  nucleic acid-binding Zn-ribbon protein